MIFFKSTQIFPEGNFTSVVTEILSPLQRCTNSLVSMKYLNMVESPPVLGPHPSLLKRHLCSLHSLFRSPIVSSPLTRRISLCARHSSHLLKTATSLNYWHRLFKDISQFQGHLFLLPHCPQKNKFYSFLCSTLGLISSRSLDFVKGSETCLVSEASAFSLAQIPRQNWTGSSKRMERNISR